MMRRVDDPRLPAARGRARQIREEQAIELGILVSELEKTFGWDIEEMANDLLDEMDGLGPTDGRGYA